MLETQINQASKNKKITHKNLKELILWKKKKKRKKIKKKQKK